MIDTYGAGAYGRMLADRSRVDAYAAAIEAVVRPGSIVLDIGTGTGFFALLAARLGARRVYAVDPTDAIRTAREVARDNGMADRIEFIQDVSTRVTLPERADVVVSDLRGVLPPFQRIVATLRDARERLLAPGGVLVPAADVLLAAPVEAERAWEDAVGPASVLGFRFAAVRRAACNDWRRGVFDPDQLLAAPREWARMDYAMLAETDVRGGAEWRAERAGTAHGLAVWFRAELAPGIAFDSGPGNTTIYQTAFFPFPEPVRLEAGGGVRAALEARLVGGDYLWRWDTTLDRDGADAISFRQSTFLATLPSPDRLRRRADTFVPRLNGNGEVAAFVLSRMDGGASVGQIARELMARFPGRFDRWEAALSHVGTFSETYGE
ncbi:50S ribosomal protein L11 methyltransferase [Longimicrobium sp.]|uniref:50S ribosomal protein L11 methyltransferase n=1 Tax=Longimicrobium sp. TaxID=2029185 RepID=UPI002BFF8933|nr:50S ribosomal protein L11 methyltransferase [Longimicrobium sp.]HSU13332.1 50S ribosomal protein L11 methyltransferase [Longimicrobium sp.]